MLDEAAASGGATGHTREQERGGDEHVGALAAQLGGGGGGVHHVEREIAGVEQAASSRRQEGERVGGVRVQQQLAAGRQIGGGVQLLQEGAVAHHHQRGGGRLHRVGSVDLHRAEAQLRDGGAAELAVLRERVRVRVVQQLQLNVELAARQLANGQRGTLTQRELMLRWRCGGGGGIALLQEDHLLRALGQHVRHLVLKVGGQLTEIVRRAGAQAEVVGALPGALAQQLRAEAACEGRLEAGDLRTEPHTAHLHVGLAHQCATHVQVERAARGSAGASTLRTHKVHHGDGARAGRQLSAQLRGGPRAQTAHQQEADALVAGALSDHLLGDGGTAAAEHHQHHLRGSVSHVLDGRVAAAEHALHTVEHLLQLALGGERTGLSGGRQRRRLLLLLLHGEVSLLVEAERVRLLEKRLELGGVAHLESVAVVRGGHAVGAVEHGTAQTHGGQLRGHGHVVRLVAERPRRQDHHAGAANAHHRRVVGVQREAVAEAARHHVHGGRSARGVHARQLGRQLMQRVRGCQQRDGASGGRSTVQGATGAATHLHLLDGDHAVEAVAHALLAPGAALLAEVLRVGPRRQRVHQHQVGQ
mmetsp:Transcript_2785/g.8734  ORF Transcript_2785/g.8734 Transcript_2785/m.8734 type:complete len:588 (-) Transcript_2785:623-2386(-)